MTDAKARPAPQTADLDKIAEEFLRLCESDCAELASIEAAAERIGATYQMLRRATLRVYDRSLLQILADVRLKKMKKLLATTDLSCRHVGICAGLDNEVRASRFFKTNEGVTMTEYREASRRHPAPERMEKETAGRILTSVPAARKPQRKMRLFKRGAIDCMVVAPMSMTALSSALTR